MPYARFVGLYLACVQSSTLDGLCEAADRIVTLEQSVEGRTVNCLGYVLEEGVVITAKHCARSKGSLLVASPGCFPLKADHVFEHPKIDVSLVFVTGVAGPPSAVFATNSLIDGFTFGVNRVGTPQAVVNVQRSMAAPYATRGYHILVKSTQNLCAGDSGGPLITQEGALAGILSRGSERCDGRDLFVSAAAFDLWAFSLLNSQGGASLVSAHEG